MIAKKITYERLVNTGNFSHEKYSIEIEIESGEKAQDAIDSAKKLIDRQFSAPTDDEIQIYEKVNEYNLDDDIPF